MRLSFYNIYKVLQLKVFTLIPYLTLSSSSPDTTELPVFRPGLASTVFVIDLIYLYEISGSQTYMVPELHPQRNLSRFALGFLESLKEVWRLILLLDGFKHMGTYVRSICL